MLSRQEIRVRFWERGVEPDPVFGPARAAPSWPPSLKGLVDRRVRAVCDGGSLDIEWPEGGEVCADRRGRGPVRATGVYACAAWGKRFRNANAALLGPVTDRSLSNDPEGSRRPSRRLREGLGEVEDRTTAGSRPARP